MEALLQIIAKWVDGFENDFEALQKSLNTALRSAEASLLRRILADVLPALKIEDGFLVSGVSNLAKANLIERVFDEIGREEVNAILMQYADSLLEITGKNAAYYYEIGVDRAKVAAIAEDLTLIRGIIGIDKEGQLLKDGFLYRLGRSEAVREKLKSYVLTSIATKQGLKPFQTGIKDLVKGGQGIDGALTSYWNQYAYDAYSKVREVDNLHFKDEVGLRHFMYQGGLIKTSRMFCVKKNGKVFTEEEAKNNWPNDPDLIDQKHKASYKPIIDRGRNNCRHFIMWITEERYNELKAAQQ
jgi:hypothetical protein